MRIVEAEASVIREHEGKASAKGELIEAANLTFASAARIWDSTVARCGGEALQCWMVNNPHFTFVIDAAALSGRLRALLDFDGDTVGMSALDRSKALYVDMYEERGTVTYEVHQWGNW